MTEESYITKEDNAEFKALLPEEKMLYVYFLSFKEAVDYIAQDLEKPPVKTSLIAKKLNPLYTIDVQAEINRDVYRLLAFLKSNYPEQLKDIDEKSSIPEIVEVLEKCEDLNLQDALVSLVELKKSFYETKVRNKIIAGEIVQALVNEEIEKLDADTEDTLEAYAEVLDTYDFPIDTRRLLHKYYKRALEIGAKKALIEVAENPAHFAPIDMEKMAEGSKEPISAEKVVEMNKKIGLVLKNLKI